MSTTWINYIQSELKKIPRSSPTTDFFLESFYKRNKPVHFFLDNWKALGWTMPILVERLGAIPVEIQWNRTSDPDYELNSYSHKNVVPFNEFAGMMESRLANDVYMTAQNKSANEAALSLLWGDVGPLPDFLDPDPSMGFFWLGQNTMTPLHHDETNNVMCHVMGTKLVRMFSPDQRDKLDPGLGVHSRLGWVTENMIAERGLRPMDVWLTPGDALFIPIGWWHCVKSIGVACTIVYTSFIWQNFWGKVPG